MPKKKIQQKRPHHRNRRTYSRSATSSSSYGNSQRQKSRVSSQSVSQTPDNKAATHGRRTFNVADEDESGALLTRRRFLYGAAGVAALAVIVGGGYAISRAGSSGGSGVTGEEILSVASDDVFTTDECTELADASTVLTLLSSHELDYGTLVWANDDNVAACLLPTDTASPLTRVALMSLETGNCTTVMEHAIGEDEGFEIFDVRASSQGIIWVEANILKGFWRVYQTTVQSVLPDSFSLGTPVLVQQGDSAWEMPTLAAVQDYAFWQVLPRSDGVAADEDSTLYRARFGRDDAEEIYVSHGRMACSPYATESGVVIAPRANASGVYYQLCYISAASASVVDTLVLPASMKPIDAGYGNTGFSFMFDAIYNYGDGIANLGTYTAAQAVPAHDNPTESADSYSSAEWFRYPRTPTAPPAWCGDWFMVKSTSSVCGVNFNTREYFALDVEEGAEDYGDYLATTGTHSRIVTFSNINYTTIDGEQVQHCLVRVWQATA